MPAGNLRDDRSGLIAGGFTDQRCVAVGASKESHPGSLASIQERGVHRLGRHDDLGSGIGEVDVIRELRRTIQIVQEEAARRKGGESGPGTVEKLAAIGHELAGIEHDPDPFQAPEGHRLHRPLLAVRLTRSWPENDPVRVAVQAVAVLLRPDPP